MHNSKQAVTALTIGLLFLMALAPQSSMSSSATQVPEGCSIVIGMYEFVGRAVEGFPNYYRALKSPLTLDRLLGVPIDENKRSQVTAVEIVGEKNLELVFWGQGDVVERRVLGRPEDRVVCEAETLELRQEVETAGDGARNWLKITRTIALTDQKDIQVTTKISGTGSAFFLFKYQLPDEEYRAIFSRKE